jgi:glutamate synthase (NADPH/NADH) small chain
MAEIKYKEAGSLLRPFKALNFLGRKPVTEPLGPRPASDNYRGFHLNDWQLCVGCSTCQKICDNQAIRMAHIPDLPEDPEQGKRAQRPAIDYGRCCWCGLCVDLCPTGSLSLSREYVHTCTEGDIGSYFVLPDLNGVHGTPFAKGWDKSEDSDLVQLQRVAMSMLTTEQRDDSFVETVNGYDEQAALVEASRCVQCGMCHDACPTHMHAPEYIRAIWNGDLEQAVEQIYRTNPLAHVCGRVCTHRCETACSIGNRGEPIAIRWLKRYAMDHVSHERIKYIATRNRSSELSAFKVAIIGAGPAGLTTAYDLAIKGCAVTIFDGLPKPGGMMRYGIPEYRLPYDKLDEEIAVIQALGVDIRCNTWIGKDISMAQLEQDYDAVLIGIGLHKGRSTRIPGSEHAQVVAAIDLLRTVTLNETFDIPKRAVVIGGGNVAMDAARTLARLQKQTSDNVDVIVTTLEAREQMLADLEEIVEAEEEGVLINNGRGPRECTVVQDKLTGLDTVCCIAVFDEDGRFHPQYDDTDICFYDADMVVEAIGQTTDYSFLGEELTERLEWERGRLKINTDGCTSEPWLWAAGDAVEGPDVVHAIAGGHRAASSMVYYLTHKMRQSA